MICLFLLFVCINNEDTNIKNNNSGIIYNKVGDIINGQNTDINEGKGFFVI